MRSHGVFVDVRGYSCGNDPKRASSTWYKDYEEPSFEESSRISGMAYSPTSALAAAAKDFSLMGQWASTSSVRPPLCKLPSDEEARLS